MPAVQHTEPPNEQQWALDYINQLPGAEAAKNIADPRVQFLVAWATTEATYQRGNVNDPLDITSSEGQQGAGDWNSFGPNGLYHVQTFQTFREGAKALDSFLQQSHDAPILQALQSAKSTPQILVNALAQSNWTGEGPAAEAKYSQEVASHMVGNPYVTAETAPPGAPINTQPPPAIPKTPTNPNTNPSALETLGKTGIAPKVTGKGGSGLLPGVVQQPPMPGVDPKDFHGFDLSAIPANMLGNAERAIQQYITQPGYAGQIRTTIAEDFGYSGGWIEKIPELYGILVWAAADLDPSTAAGQNMFLGAVQNTTWWQETDQNQRAWEEELSQDPATAHEAITQARDHVIGTANQIGVNLSAAQVDSIANVFAAQSFTQTAVIGSESGTSQDWLDQAVVDTALNIKASGSVTGAVTGSGKTSVVSENYSGGIADLSGNENPQELTGIASQLFSKFQSVAQNYLLYDTADPSRGLLTNAQLMNYVDDALRNYTGSGSFGSSNLINGAVANFTTQMMDQATKMYPSLAGPIAQGVSPSTYVQPIQSQIAQMMYGSSDYAQEINLLSPEWNWAIATPDKQGNKTVLTPDQVAEKLVNTPQYRSSPVAVTNARNFAQSLVTGLGYGA